MKTAVIAIGLFAMIVIGCGSTPSPSTVAASTPVVVIPSGATARMTATQVADRVLSLIRGNEVAVGHVLKPARILSEIASGAAPTIVWLVRAEGTFTNNRTGPGGSPGTATSGYYRISDADGSILEFGFP